MLRQGLFVLKDLLIGHWPIVLIFCILASLVMLVLLRWLWRLWHGHEVQEEVVPSPRATVEKAPFNSARSSLDRLDSRYYHCWNDLYVPRLADDGLTHLPFVVLSRHGIFVIQTQAESGEIRGTTSDPQWTCQGATETRLFPNPLMRNDYHVRALAKALDLPEVIFFSIILFERKVALPDSLPDNVLTSGLGRHIISYRPEIISPEVFEKARFKLDECELSTDRSTAQIVYSEARRSRLRELRGEMLASIS